MRAPIAGTAHRATREIAIDQARFVPAVRGRRAGGTRRQCVLRVLGALGFAAACLALVLGLYAATPGASVQALQHGEPLSLLDASATGAGTPIQWAQAITTTFSQVLTSTEMAPAAANGPLTLEQSVDTGTDNPDVAYNGERITYTLTIVNESGSPVTLTGPISLTNEIPQSAGQVQLDHIWCSDECLLGITEQLVTSPLGESVVVTTVESVAWEITAAKGQTLTLAVGETITRSFAGRVSGQPDGTIIGNSAVVFYEADGAIGFASPPDDLQTTVRVRPSLEGTSSLSDAPTWLSRDAGGTLSIDWGDFDRDGDLDLALGSTSGTSVYRNDGGRLILFWEVPIYTLGVRWADLDGEIANLELVAVGQSDGNSAVTPGTNYVYHLNAGGTAFMPSSTFGSEMQLLRVVAADWTNDGKVDLVASTNAIDAQCPVRLFANQGDGSFVGPGTCVSDEPTANIAAGDWDNDDDPDLVVGAFPNRTWLLANNGTADPLTSAPVEVDASATFLPYDFAWGDYDRDGYLDLAAAYPIDRKVRIYHNEAGSGFSHSAELEFRTSLFYTPLTVEWGDLDGNGFLDLIVADSPPVVYLNGGLVSPGFSSTRSIPLSPLSEGGQIWSVRAADQDGDGDLDLAFANRDGASLLMTSFSGFLDATLFPVGLARGASSVAWADVDDNGYLDLLYGAGPTVLRTVLYRNSQGVFAAAPLQTSDLGPGAVVAVGTMDGNSALDLAIGSLAGLQLYLDGDVTATPWVPDVSTGVDALAWGDAEHDGDLDLLVAQEGDLVLYVNETGQLPGTPMLIAGGDGDLRSVAWGDYDGDNYPDIAVGRYGQANRIYHNESGNVYRLVPGSSAVSNTTSVAWADYDRDGDLDLAAGNYGQRNAIYQNVGGVLSAEPVWSSAEMSKTTSIAWGDWDNDGDLDLAVGNDGERDQVYVNQGSTPQSAQFVWVWSSAEKLATTGVAWGDADRDGDLDLAISQSGGGRNGIYVNNDVVPSHLADVFVPTMALPDNPSYLSIDRPGTVPDAYFSSSSELLSGDQVAIHYRVHDPDGTRSGGGSNEQGDPVHSMRYEYSLDGGGTWHLATEYTGPLSPPVTYPLPSSRLGTSYTYYWNPEADGAVSDNARFRVTIVPLKEVGPVRRGAAMASSPPFRVRATTCVWPVDPTITIVPPHPEPGDMVQLIGSVSGGSGVLTYTWELSDGRTLTGQVVEHRFAQWGTYQVTMTVHSEPCPIAGVVTARQSVVVGSEVLSVYLPLVLRSQQGGASASNLPDIAAAPAGRSYWETLQEAGQVGGTEVAGQEASLPTYYLQPALQSLGMAPLALELQAVPLPATYPDGIVTVSSCITSCVVLPVTKDARGIHTQPSIGDKGDRVAFWSTGNLGGIRSGFHYDLPVVLLVDDDDNSPDVRPTYEAALDALGVSYDVWDTGTSNSHEPTLDVLSRYRTIIWFSGDEWSHGAAGPGAAAEGALASYLDGGDERCLFISSQDYHYNRGLTPFMQSYLGVGSVQGDVGVTSVAGAGVFAGLGAYSLSYPGSNYSDWINPLPSNSVGFTGQTGAALWGPTSLYRDVGSYRTTFWAYPFEAIVGTEQRAAAMDAVLNLCNTRRYVPSLVINEVDLANSMVELYNFSMVPVDTANVIIEASNDSAVTAKFVALGTIPPYGYATVSFGVDWATSSGGSVSLYQAGEHGVDFVRWGTSSAEPRMGTYWLGSNPAKPGDLDNTLARGDDTNAGSDWCEGEPTLGRKNPGCGAGFNNADGNIEAYWAEIGILGDITYTQVTSTSGSILGGFNLWPSLDGESQHIAFFSDRDLTGRNQDANFEIWRYDLAAGTFLQVTESRECVNLYPSISADGTRVVFASDCDLAGGGNTDGNQEIYLAEIGPTGAVSLTQLSTTQNMLNDQPAISADGTRAAFVQDANAAGDIIVYDISGATPAPIRTYDGGVAAQPSLNADGTYIAFALQADGDNQEIYRAEVDAPPGASVTQVTSTTVGATNDQPALSGDGLRVAYVTDTGPDAGIWLYDLVDRIRTRIATAGDSNSRPAVSGNGTFVAFSSNRQIYRAEFPLVDLAIEKRSAPVVFTPGRAVTYTITVTNYGPSAALGAIVSDTIPSEIPSVTWACAGYGGAACSLPQGSVLYHPITLPAESMVVYTATGVLSPSVTADVVNVAEVIPPPQVSEHVRDNNVTPPNVKTPVPEADVAIFKTASLDQVVAGETLTYTLSYANLKPSDARPVCITDTLPAGVTFGGEVVPPAYFVLEAQGPAVRWCTARLPAQATGDIVFTVTVQSSVTGTLTNTATIASSVYDPTPHNNDTVLTTTVTTRADLALLKTASPASLNAGEMLTYTLVYTNYGPSDAMGVRITDSLPVSVTWSGHATATPALNGPAVHGQELVWNTPQVAAGTSGRIDYTVVVSDAFGAPGQVANGAVISSTTVDPLAINNSDLVTTTVTVQADLAVVKSGEPVDFIPGGEITYTITVANAGSVRVPGATVYDPLPDVFKHPPSWTCSAPGGSSCGSSASGTGTIDATVDLEAGASITYVVVGTLDPSIKKHRDSVTNTAWVTAPVGYDDPNPGNNHATATNLLHPRVNLQVTKSDSGPAVAGSVLTYTVAITNAGGPSDATNVLVTDQLPTGVSYGGLVSASMPVNETGPSGGEVIWALDTLTADLSGTIVFTVTVDADHPAGTLANEIAIESDAGDEEVDASDNQYTLDTPVTIEADLSISQSASTPVVAGGNVTYTIAYTNAGPSYAQNVLITDVLPSGTTLVEANPAASGGLVLNWTLGTLGDGGSGTIEVVVTVGSDVTADLTNAVTVTASTTDPDWGDNSGVLVTPVSTEADLWVQKVDGPDPAVAGERITYTISYGNDGPSDVLNVTITDDLPADAIFYSADPAATQNGQTLSWALGARTAGASSQITVVVTVPSTATGSIANSVTIDSATSDGNLSNNSAQASTQIESHVNLAMTQTAPAAVNPGGVLTYTLVYTNVGGPSTAHGVVVTDLLAADVTFGGMVSGASPLPSGSLLTWDLGVLDAGASGTLQFTATVGSAVADGTVLVNQAGIASGDVEVDDSDNAVEAATTVTTATLVMGTDATWMMLAAVGERADISRSPLQAIYLALGAVGALGYGATWAGRGKSTF
ncbi:MAG: FG-GAP-like repeat-containing protein [Anaerolineae bacterium]